MDRVDRVEEQLRQEIKEINEKVTDIKVSLEGLNVKVDNLQTFNCRIQNTGFKIFVEIFKWILMVGIAVISGIFGHKFIK